MCKNIKDILLSYDGNERIDKQETIEWFNKRLEKFLSYYSLDYKNNDIEDIIDYIEDRVYIHITPLSGDNFSKDFYYFNVITEIPDCLNILIKNYLLHNMYN